MSHNTIRNRTTVAKETTKYARATGKSPDAALQHKIASRKLYDRGKYLILAQEKRGHPQPKFERVEISPGVLAWSPMNDEARKFFAGMNEEEKYEFMFHPPPERKVLPCESRRVVDGSPIKGLPNGHREADYFPSDRSPRKSAIRTADSFSEPVPELSPEDLNHILAAITASSVT